MKAILAEITKRPRLTKMIERVLPTVTAAVMAAPTHRARALYLTMVLGWRIDDRAYVGRNIKVLGHRPVVVGRATRINPRATIDSRGGLRIGANTDVASDARILTADHDPDSATFTYRERGVIVGDRCWVATGAIVLPGTVLADGVLVAAGAVASGKLAKDYIYVGNPATKLRDRNTTAQSEV